MVTRVCSQNIPFAVVSFNFREELQKKLIIVVEYAF